MRPTPLHPWSPGSVRPVRLRPGPRDDSHEQVDQPKPLRELAEAHGVRWGHAAEGGGPPPYGPAPPSPRTAPPARRRGEPCSVPGGRVAVGGVGG